MTLRLEGTDIRRHTDGDLEECRCGRDTDTFFQYPGEEKVCVSCYVEKEGYLGRSGVKPILVFASGYRPDLQKVPRDKKIKGLLSKIFHRK